MKVSVLGCGRWGSFITWYLSSRGHEVCEWGRESSKDYQILKQTGKNEYVKLNNGVNLTSDLPFAIDFADVAIISIKSQALREVALKIKDMGAKDKPVVLCMKGLEEDTGKRLSEIMLECGYDKDKIENYRELPFLPVRLFKELSLKSIEKEEIVKTMTSVMFCQFC